MSGSVLDELGAPGGINEPMLDDVEENSGASNSPPAPQTLPPLVPRSVFADAFLGRSTRVGRIYRLIRPDLVAPVDSRQHVATPAVHIKARWGGGAVVVLGLSA